jgi:uncharacterized membrane protein
MKHMPRSLLISLLISATLCLALASLTYGTNDVLFFQSYVVKAAHDGTAALYRDGANLVAYHPNYIEPMAHPPAMLTLWAAVQSLEQVTGVPFRFWFRLLTTIAYLTSVVLVWQLSTAKAAMYYALCPAAIMISGFHGNSDPLIVAMLLASVYAVECKDRPKLAGVLYGIALSIKVWPLFLVLAFMLGLKTWRTRLYFGGLALATVVVLALPHILADPRLIITTVMGYRSRVICDWGLSRWSSYVRIGVPVTFAAIAIAVVYLRKRQASLTCMIGSSILVFLVLTPGFGVQYLAWILPFCFIFCGHIMSAVYATTSVFVGIIYTYWSGGIPWYFADALRERSGSQIVMYFAALCWLVLAISAVRFLVVGTPLKSRN